jgi:hypothetical protein
VRRPQNADQEGFMSETTTAQSAADQARAKTQELGAQAKDKAEGAGAQAKEKAQQAGAQARGRVRDEVDRRSTQAGEQATSTAQALRHASERLRDDGNEPVAKGIEQVAGRVDSAASWLRESDGDRILREVENFGRRNPLAVVAGGAALGFVASRLLKASSRRRYEQSGVASGNGQAQAPELTAPERLSDAGWRGGTPASSPPVGTPAAAPASGWPEGERPSGV